jgi:hypothetical protein
MLTRLLRLPHDSRPTCRPCIRHAVFNRSLTSVMIIISQTLTRFIFDDSVTAVSTIIIILFVSFCQCFIGSRCISEINAWLNIEMSSPSTLSWIEAESKVNIMICSRSDACFTLIGLLARELNHTYSKAVTEMTASFLTSDKERSPCMLRSHAYPPFTC